MGFVRTQVQFEEEQHRRLREEAFRRGMSISALLREMLDEEMRRGRPPRRDKRRAMAFVGSGRDTATDVSERHDDYLDRLYAEERSDEEPRSPKSGRRPRRRP